MIRRFSQEICERLAWYVYAYVDPRDGAVFYIGKGKGNRVFSHLHEGTETKKNARIAAIADSGTQPQVDILVHGLSENEALRVEAVCIDIIGLDNLTNLISGHSSQWGGRRSIEEVVTEMSAQFVEVDDPVIAININQTYRHGMSDDDLYDCTRGIWRLNPDNAERKGRYAFAVYQGVVKEVYSVQRWLPAGSTAYHRRVFEPEDLEERYEFEGTVAPEHIREKYVGRRIKPHAQNPIRYLP